MRDSTDFRTTVRRGTRGVQPCLIAHVASGSDERTTVGFVVSKAVGSAVDRNRVKRRLRHLMRDRVDQLPVGSRIVVRALPSSASASWHTLGAQLDAALQRSSVLR
ncbi:MAG: ribonuclease P protein component [Aeromicrobium sp.]|uniref:ribonuclease P protein component n=1 Tax=Aeromicrobium sp. TaxID=1871063 RepID=UPI003C65849E